MPINSLTSGLPKDWLNQPLDADYYRKIMEMAAAAVGTQAPRLDNDGYRMEVLRLRMRWASTIGPFQRIITHYSGPDNEIVLVIVHKDDAVILRDDAGLYPSDTLITQLRLLTE